MPESAYLFIPGYAPNVHRQGQSYPQPASLLGEGVPFLFYDFIYRACVCDGEVIERFRNVHVCASFARPVTLIIKPQAHQLKRTSIQYLHNGMLLVGETQTHKWCRQGW